MVTAYFTEDLNLDGGRRKVALGFGENICNNFFTKVNLLFADNFAFLSTKVI